MSGQNGLPRSAKAERKAETDAANKGAVPHAPPDKQTTAAAVNPSDPAKTAASTVSNQDTIHTNAGGKDGERVIQIPQKKVIDTVSEGRLGGGEVPVGGGVGPQDPTPKSS